MTTRTLRFNVFIVWVGIILLPATIWGQVATQISQANQLYNQNQFRLAYLGNTLNLQGTAITATEVEEKLMKGNFSAEEIQATRELLEKHETLQYAPTTGTIRRAIAVPCHTTLLTRW